MNNPAIGLTFDNSYRRLPSRFYAELPPRPVTAPRLVALNEPLAAALGVDVSDRDRLAEVFAGNRLPDGAEPVSVAYAGHQFGNFVPQLGDGRACLLGEVLDRAGERFDVVLKGSGPTPFSRNGDGRAALGPVLREYIVSEAMHRLNIPTTRALAAVTTGEPVYREEMLPGAVLVRIAASHIRVGTFEYFAARGDTEAVRTLADHVIARHYPALASDKEPYLALLRAVVERQAALVAQWLAVGFIHGVMNTDNTTLSGETIDYGPCAFMDEYHPATVFSSIDLNGRYAYANQPRIAQWNLARLAETLLPLIAEKSEDAIAPATQEIQAFDAQFNAQWTRRLYGKLGLFTPKPDDAVLVEQLLDAMQTAKADFTSTFRRLSELTTREATVGELFGDEGNGWFATWATRLAREGSAESVAARMRSVNPAVIPRNHLIERVIRAAVDYDDFAPFHALNEVLAHPFEDPSGEEFTRPPQPNERVLQTFCGT